jgi:DNA-binding transcriptional MerR regulator
MASKSKDAFRTISEVAKWLDVPAHVLRFWESKFPQIKPVKRAGGRRYYRPADMVLIGGIKTMLHDQGLTIRGVQKKLKEDGVEAVCALSPAVNDKNMPETPSKVIEEVASPPPEPEIEEAPFIEAIEEPIETGGDNVVSLQREDAPTQETTSEDEERPDMIVEEEPDEAPAPLETKSIDMPAAPDLDAVTIDASRQAAAETIAILRRCDVRNLVGREDIAYLEHKARAFRDKLAAAVGEQDD